MTSYEKVSRDYQKISWENEIKINILSEDTFSEKEKIKELRECIVDDEEFIRGIIIELAYIDLLHLVSMVNDFVYKVDLEALKKYRDNDAIRSLIYEYTKL